MLLTFSVPKNVKGMTRKCDYFLGVIMFYPYNIGHFWVYLLKKKNLLIIFFSEYPLNRPFKNQKF